MNLKEIRLARQLTEKQLANYCGLDEAQMSRFETYKALPIPSDMEMICNVLGCKVSDIYSQKEIAYKKIVKQTDPRKLGRYHLTCYLDNKYRGIEHMVHYLGYKGIAEWIAENFEDLCKRYHEKEKEASLAEDVSSES